MSFVLRANYALATRTAFGDATTSGSMAEILWSEGDELVLFSSSESLRLRTGCAGRTAKFSPSDDQDAARLPKFEASSDFIALYPYQSAASADFPSASLSAEIPSSQEALKDTYDPLAFLAVARSGDLVRSEDQLELNMSFYNVCGGLCFTLSRPSDYSSIKFYGNNSEPVCGSVDISLKTPDTPLAVSAGGGNNTKITLAPPAGGSFEEGARYYITILPGHFLQGFTLEFELKSGGKKTCTCSSSLSFKRNTFSFVSDADKEDKIAAIRDAAQLAPDGKAANCYLVSAPGTYKLPLVRGIDRDDLLYGVARAEVLWETFNTSSAPSKESIVQKLAIKNNDLVFTVPSPIKNGNALIAAKSSSGEILWSWHIWVCKDFDLGASAQRLEGKASYMLDRNLGALAASPDDALSNGLFYQWGRKDPFPGPLQRNESSSTNCALIATSAGSLRLTSSSSATVAYTVAHPTEYITSTDGRWLHEAENTLWDKKKTSYDPCPVGWKVPTCYSYSNGQHVLADEAWNGVEYQRVQSSSEGYGAYFNTVAGSRAWYPNTGYLNMSGVLCEVGQYSLYWSCNPTGVASYGMELSRNSQGAYTLNPYQSGKNRGEGHAVRCIEDN